jgi:DNA (cytosine-5)-methyltransferase 3A
MNVLSLFDGMSCGQIALNRAGIKYDKYFASEIDTHAMKVTLDNYPDTIQLGSVLDLNGSELPKIDLLIGGSPCQSFSRAGNGTGFDGKSGLFWEYVRIKNEINPKYFLLENVKMKNEWEDIITKELGVEPIMINSNLVSAQNRERLYWTNIPVINLPEDRGILIKDIVDLNSNDFEYIDDDKTKIRVFKKNYLQYDINGTGHGSQDQRAYYLNGKHGCLDTGASGKAKILENDGRVRKITRNEGERLQCVPIDYTISVSRSQALKMLGNGWTVDVIAHIFKNIK